MSTRLSDNPSLTTLERRFYTDYVRLTVDRSRCVFCDICVKICPKSTIRLTRKEGVLTISVNEECSLCGACEPFCPSGAIVLTVNGNRLNPIVSSGGFPKPLPKVEIDSSKCKPDCFKCAEACPRGALNIDEKHSVNIDYEKCLRCPYCEDACPEGAVKVNPLFEGLITIDESKCEENCDACVKICPTKALSKNGGRISVNPRYCILCNACTHLDVCRNNAIKLVRRRVLYEGEGFSATWTNAVEKILGARILSMELDAKGHRKIRKLIEEAKL